MRMPISGLGSFALGKLNRLGPPWRTTPAGDSRIEWTCARFRTTPALQFFGGPAGRVVHRQGRLGSTFETRAGRTCSPKEDFICIGRNPDVLSTAVPTRGVWGYMGSLVSQGRA